MSSESLRLWLITNKVVFVESLKLGEYLKIGLPPGRRPQPLWAGGCELRESHSLPDSCVFPVSLSSLIFFSGGRQLFNQQHGRLIVHNSRASICQDRGIVQRNVAAAF